MSVTPQTWIVDSDYTGELRARQGLAQRLNFPVHTIPRPDALTRAYLQARLEHCHDSQPSHIILINGTGEETTAAVAELATSLPVPVCSVFLASILPDTPHPRLWDYHLIASPQLHGKGIIHLPCVPHTMTDARLQHARARHAADFANLPRPLTAVLIGGNTRYCFGFDRQHAHALAARLRQFWQQFGGSLWLSDSRRTPPEAWQTLLDDLSDLPLSAQHWQHADADHYPALLAHADYCIVTGDSLSMCSEATFTGKPVWVDLTETTTESYHRAIIGNMQHHGLIQPLRPPYHPYHYPRPDPTEQVAQAVLAYLTSA
ncbi:MAG: ELM1/GtrOC1 family putative glycosyltransferase [Methylococcales bacterium]|nr:ELM1/GtrOC1 family putative glycosyltransferase [Methylococcales bacterium]